MTPSPKLVLDKIQEYYSSIGGAANRGAHRLSVAASNEVARIRGQIAQFLNAPSSSIVFTANQTHASCLAANLIPLSSRQSVLLSPWLHHASMVPWLQRIQTDLLGVQYLPSPPSGRFPLDEVIQHILPSTTIAVIPLVNMVYGTINPIREITHILHEKGIIVIVDGTHGAGHFPVDVRGFDCDMFYCSGNIGLMGPLGTGILYIHANLLEKELRSPLIIGDGGVRSVSYQGYQLLPAPERYEAGITAIPGLMGLEAATQYLDQANLSRLAEYENRLIRHLLSRLTEVPNILLYGDTNPHNRVGLLGINIKSLNPHDLAIILDETANIQTRSGMLCGHPIVHSLSSEGMVQISLHGYNSIEQIDYFIDRLKVISTELV